MITSAFVSMGSIDALVSFAVIAAVRLTAVTLATVLIGVISASVGR
jgi:hypothetical protein